MDIATLIGLILGISVVLAAILVDSSLLVFLNLPGFLIVVCGTLAATFVKFPMAKVFTAFITGGKAAFAGEKSNARAIYDLALEYAGAVRKDGLLALEKTEIPDDYFKKGIRLCIDGHPKEVVEQVLSSEMELTIQRHEEGEKIFRAIGDSAPAFGMIGTLIGLVQMLSNMSDPKTIGPAMAIALLTTLYGALIANLIALPMADKLGSKTGDERVIKSLIKESVLQIQKQQNPSILAEILETYLPENQRTAGEVEEAAEAAE